MNIEQRREFLHNYNELVELFGQDLVDEGLMRYTEYQLLQTQDYPLKDADGRSLNPGKPYGPHIYIGRASTYYRFTNSVGREKSVFVPVERYKVCNQYQHNYQAEHIVKPAMLTLYPWLADFKLSIYSIYFYEGRKEEFYVKLSDTYSGHTYLYVPYKAFMEGDVEAIIKRNEEYLKWYTKSDGVWNTMREDPAIDAFLSKVKENKK